MNNLITVSGVSGYIDENGVAQLNLENCARGLGFTQIAASGNEVIRWERVNKYLEEFGFIPTSGDGGFIPENIFYRLAMKANNKTAVDFQAKIANEILPAIRKTGSYSIKPKSIEDLIILQAQSVKELKTQVAQQAKAITENKEAVQSIRDVVSLSTTSWRRDTATLITKMARTLGGTEHISDLRKESYKLLDTRFGVSLETRLTNKRQRMALEGVCKSKLNALNHLDVITEDKKLIEGYVAIIKEMAIKYGV